MASVFVLLEAFNRKEAAALGFFPCATASSHLAQTRPVWGGCSASRTDATSPAKPPLGAFVGLWGGVSRTTYYWRVKLTTHKITIL